MESAGKFTVVGLGEILWDVLPSGKQLGGAPANFAYIASLLGDRGIPASRIGTDALGMETLAAMSGIGLDSAYIQRDRLHQTGTARVALDSTGQARFTITEAVAWDFLEWTPQWEGLARRCDAVCFGTLAQRSPASQAAILKFLQAVRATALRIFDVNLRQAYYSDEMLAASFGLCDIAKVNHEELPIVSKLLALPPADERQSAENLRRRFSLQLVCVTRGTNGSLLVAESKSSSHPGFQVTVADTVGAGDAFTACLAHHYLRKHGLEEMNAAANRLAAWVASCPGATPSLQGKALDQVLPTIAAK